MGDQVQTAVQLQWNWLPVLQRTRTKGKQGEKGFLDRKTEKRKLFGILLNIYKSLNIRSFKKIALLPVGQRQIARHSEAKAECYRT